MIGAYGPLLRHPTARTTSEEPMSTMTGKLLNVDLTALTAVPEDIPRSHYANFLSARGLGVKYLYDRLKPGADPMGPENILVLGLGMLGATRLQGFSKWCAVTKSPLTGTVMRSFAGGNFGVWLKWAGFDQIIVTGRAEKPTYVYIDETGVKFLDATPMAGMDPRRTQEWLKEKHGAHTESASIGLGGEKLVRYAVITSGERTASRGGVGTVMGAKNLKAIAINVPPVKFPGTDESEFKKLAQAQIGMLKDNPRRKTLNSMGTPYITTGLMEKGILPVKNFREGSISGIEEISGDRYLEIKEAQAGCYACMTRCGGMRKVKDGPWAGTSIDGPEYETVFSLGPAVGITDRQFIIDANALCDYYGIDTISAGVSAAFAIEAYERGALTLEDVGFELKWGDRDSVMRLLEMIGKGEGVGALLGQGVKAASEKLGKGSRDYAIHIKGLEIPGYEPRSLKSYALSMAVSNIGGSHMYGRPRDELAGKVDPYSETGEGKGASIAAIQKDQAVEDSLVACTFGNSGLSPKDYVAYLAAGPGLGEIADPETLRTIGERILCLERLFNVREGFGRKDDALPARMSGEALMNAGPATGQKVEKLDGLLDEYYEALGYDENGVPKAETVRRLGL